MVSPVHPREPRTAHYVFTWRTQTSTSKFLAWGGTGTYPTRENSLPGRVTQRTSDQPPTVTKGPQPTSVSRPAVDHHDVQS